MEDCIFCKLSNTDTKIYETDSVYVMLDIKPITKGHCLVIPKNHYTNIYDVDNQVLSEIIVASKAVACRMKEKLNCIGVNILQNNEKPAGQFVDHIHFHVIPRYENDGFHVKEDRHELSSEEKQEMKNKMSMIKKEDVREEPEEKVIANKKDSDEELRKWGLDDEFD